MQAVILAGGKGTRLAPLTYSVPKPMVSVCGKPFLQHLLELLKSWNLTDVLILACYLGQQMENYFGDGIPFGMNIRYSYEKEPLGTGGALRNAQDMLDETFLLFNGDTFLPINYNLLITRFEQSGRIAMVVAYGGPEQIAPNNLKVRNGRVVACNKDYGDSMTHLDAGVVAMKKEVLKLIAPEGVCSLEKEVLPGLIKAGELVAFETQQRFYDMGSFEGLSTIEKVLV
jgi:NDP-sugar pyrophosphorylase family protein